MIGFNSLKSELLAAHQNEKLHHAILLNGKSGTGKASFAVEFAKDLLKNKAEINPDLLLITKEEKKKNISVDQIRKIASFVNKTAAASPYKFIIIDSACELNKSSSNALLKVLEEPHQNNFLILISHNLNKILPTIRSRCQIIKAPTLSLDEFHQVLQQQNLEFPENDAKFLASICINSPADAINFGLDLIRFYELFLRSLFNKKIGEELLKKISDKSFNFNILEKSFEFFINRLLKQISGISSDLYFDEEKVFLRLTQKLSAQEIFKISDDCLTLINKTATLSLDKKLTFINVFNRICYG